jgi:hypothetical protein
MPGSHWTVCSSVASFTALNVIAPPDLTLMAEGVHPLIILSNLTTYRKWMHYAVSTSGD